MNETISRALKTAREFMDLLREMELAYDARNDVSKRWVYKDQEILQKWIDALELAHTTEDVNAVWREIQDISRILGCTLEDALGERYRKLQSRLFEEMTEVIAAARRDR